MSAPYRRGRTTRTGPASLRSPHEPDDAVLITLVHDGITAAYGVLYRRHRDCAYHLARQLAPRSRTDQDDLVAEAFRRVLEALQAGAGPRRTFRAYLLTTLRHIAYDKTRRDRRLTLVNDLGEAAGVPADAVSVEFTDPAVSACDRTLAAAAFAHLPPRWQVVLWHTEIEHRAPAEVAPALGLTANAVAALAYRARNRLRQEYLQAYLATASVKRHRTITSRLGAWARDSIPPQESTEIGAHLKVCAECRALAVELSEVNSSFRTA